MYVRMHQYIQENNQNNHEAYVDKFSLLGRYWESIWIMTNHIQILHISSLTKLSSQDSRDMGARACSLY